jgi:hypothetical protein
VFQVSGLLPKYSPTAHELWLYLSPSKDGHRAILEGQGTVSCSTAWSLPYIDSASHSIIIIFRELEPVVREIGRLTLPLSWFPPNAIVTHEFPCRILDPRLYPTPFSALLVVHRSENNAVPFAAPDADLRVGLRDWRKARPQPAPMPFPHAYPGIPIAYPGPIIGPLQYDQYGRPVVLIPFQYPVRGQPLPPGPPVYQCQPPVPARAPQAVPAQQRSVDAGQPAAPASAPAPAVAGQPGQTAPPESPSFPEDGDLFELDDLDEPPVQAVNT